jgi:Flp pilus assembly protein TadD
MNLGACLHLVGKLSEAETHYLEAARLSPGDRTTEINMGRLHNVMRKKGMKTKEVPKN